MQKKQVFLLCGVLAAGSFTASEAMAGARMVTPDQVRIAAPQQRPAVATQSAARENWVGQKAIMFDRASGKLRTPTRSEAAALVKSLRQLTSHAVSKPAVRSNGGSQVAIEGGVPNVVVARATADGQMETKCVQTFEEAVDFLGLVSQGTGDEQ